MNTYVGELCFVQSISDSLKPTVPYTVDCLKQLKADSKSKALSGLLTQLASLVDQVLTMCKSLNSSLKTTFLQNAKTVNSAIEFIRKTTVTFWLKEILHHLMPIPEELAKKLDDISSVAVGHSFTIDNSGLTIAQRVA